MNSLERGNLAEKKFLEGYGCAQSIVLAFSDILPFSKSDLSKMASSFGGGIGRLRETCGVVSAISLILGMLYGYSTPETGEVKANHYKRVQEVCKMFENEFGSLRCGALLGKNGHDEPNPTPRTKEFYENRPCGKFINFGAKILHEYIDANPL